MKIFSKVPFKSLAATAVTFVIFATPNANAAGFCETTCGAVGAGVKTLVYTYINYQGRTSCNDAAKAAADEQVKKDPSKAGALAASVFTSCMTALGANADVAAQQEGDKAYASCMNSCTGSAAYGSVTPVRVAPDLKALEMA